MKLCCLCPDILVQKHQHVCLSWSSGYLPWHCRDMSVSGEVRDSSTVAVPSLQPSVISLAMDLSFVECMGDIRTTYSLLSVQLRTWSGKVLCTGRPLPCFTLTHGVISWMQVHGHHGWRWAKGFLCCSHTSLHSSSVMPQSPNVTLITELDCIQNNCLNKRVGGRRQRNYNSSHSCWSYVKRWP